MNDPIQKLPRLRTTVSLLATTLLAACGGAGTEPAAAPEAEHLTVASNAGATKHIEAAAAQTAWKSAPAPDGSWQQIAVEGKSFTLAGTQAVRYGINSTWIETPVTNSGTCSNVFFGKDPDPGLKKQCFAPKQVAVINPGPGVFVDAAAGSDSNPGTFALPWKTLAKLTSAQVKTGEGVYLMCGGVWRESLSLTTTQLATGAIVAGYGPCGATTKATISGADDFSAGWVKSGQIWSRSVPTSTPKISRLFINGEAMRIAQWPNATSTTRGFALTNPANAAAPNALSVAPADEATLAGKDILGAPVQIRHGGAQLDTNAVKSYNGSTGLLTLANATSYAIIGNNGYLLQDKLWMLDTAGEFYHDQAGGKLYVWPTTSAAQSNLNGTVVEGSVRDLGLQLSNAAQLKISNLATVMTRSTGMVIYNAATPTLQAIDASDNGRTGLQVVTSGSATGSNGALVQNSSFSRNLVYGLDATSLQSGTIKSNTVSDTGTLAFVGQVQAGIWSGPGTVVDGNVVSRSTLTGIRFEGAGGSVVQNNLIQDSCLGSSDCGGIDTWNGPKRSGWMNGQLSRVQGNVVARAPVNLEGAAAGTPTFNAGIYMDNFAANSTVSGNTVLDVPIGINVHNSSNITLDSNKLLMTSQAGIWANMDQTDADYMTGNVYKNNQLVPANWATGIFPTTPVASRSEAIWFWHKLLAETSITSGSNIFTGNDIVQLNDPTIPVAWVREFSGDVHMSASAWNQFNPLDPAARTPELFALYLTNLNAELMANGNFDSGLTGWSSWFSSAVGILGKMNLGSVTGCTSNCLVFSPMTVNDTLFSPSFNMTVGSLYRLGFNASYAALGTVSKPGFGLASRASGAVVTGPTSATFLNGVAGQTIPYEGFLTATSSASSTLKFSATAGTVVGLDAISLREVTGFSLSKPSDWGAYGYANGSTPVTVDCAALGWPSGCQAIDVDGAPVALPVTLPANSAKLFLRADSGFRTH